EGLAKETFLANIINPGLAALGYNPLSPTADPLPNMHRLQGLYMATAVYGWSEFSIDPNTQALNIKTWGIDPYNQAQLDADPAGVTGRTPQIISEFAVTPVLAPAAHLVGTNLVVNGGAGNDQIDLLAIQGGSRIVVESSGVSIGQFDASQVAR